MPVPPSPPPADVVALLEAQHAEIRRLFNLVESTEGDAKADAFSCLVRLLAAHETAEEEVVHPAARGLDGGEAVVAARIEEESSAKQALADLEDLGVDGDGFDVALAAFRADVDRHAGNEEAQEFPLLRARLTADEGEQLAEQVRVAESVAPTHPHPHGPDGALGNLVVGPFVAVADRVRDALSGR